MTAEIQVVGAITATMALPVPAIAAYLKYELTIPNNWDIRVDLVILWLALSSNVS